MPFSMDLPNQGIKPASLMSPALARGFITTSTTWKAQESVQFSCSVVSDSATQQTAVWQASLSFTNSQSLLRLMSIKLVMSSNYVILCRPLLLLPSIFPSIWIFSDQVALHIRWPKCWSFSFSISPSSEYSGLISVRIGWFDLLAVKGLSRVYSRTTVRKHLAFSLLYGPTLTSISDYWKNHSFDCMDFVGKVMSLRFNTLSRFVIGFLPRSKCLLISWLQ